MHMCQRCGEPATLRLSRMGGWSCLRCALRDYRARSVVAVGYLERSVPTTQRHSERELLETVPYLGGSYRVLLN